MTLSAKAETIFADLPDYYSTDPNIIAYVDTAARELQRIEDLLEVLREQVFPQNADDDYGLLGLWEQTLGLPVEPADATLVQRRNRVISAVLKRRSGAGSDWVASVTQALGTSGWTYLENDPGDYQLSVVLPYSPTAITALDGEHTLPDATIDVDDASVLSTSGTVRIGDQFVDYTGITVNQLTGCTGGTGTWPGGTSVTQGTQYTTGQAETLLRQITPAHLELVLAYDAGFLVDMNIVDEDAI